MQEATPDYQFSDYYNLNDIQKVVEQALKKYSIKPQQPDCHLVFQPQTFDEIMQLIKERNIDEEDFPELLKLGLEARSAKPLYQSWKEVYNELESRNELQHTYSILTYMYAQLHFCSERTAKTRLAEAKKQGILMKMGRRNQGSKTQYVLMRP